MITRRRSRRSSGQPRAKTTWDQKLLNFSLIPAGGQHVADISHELIIFADEPAGTCKRLVGNINLYADSIVGAEEANFALGIAVVTEDALTAFAVPDSQFDLDQDWYYWYAWRGLVGNTGGGPQLTVNFDIHSVRRLRGGYRLMLTIQHTITEVQNRLTWNARTLWSLP